MPENTFDASVKIGKIYGVKENFLKKVLLIIAFSEALAILFLLLRANSIQGVPLHFSLSSGKLTVSVLLSVLRVYKTDAVWSKKNRLLNRLLLWLSW